MLIESLEIIKLFFIIGLTSFGGPSAHVAMMEQQFVHKLKWLSQQEFLDFYAATQFIPGPNSTELALHIGYKKAGLLGLVLAGFAFILPAFTIVFIISYFYKTYGSLPNAQALLAAVKPVILAVITLAVFNLAKTALKNKILIATAVIAFGLYIFGVNELLILLSCGLVYCLIHVSWSNTTPFVLLSLITLMQSVKANAQNLILNQGIPLEKVFLYFAKVGALLFGSGYVLIAFLESDLVKKYQWLSEQQLLDAISIGQFTPGPVFTTATFIGYILSGPKGALVATLGIFAPAFFFVAITAPFLNKIRTSPMLSLGLDAVNAASLSLMAAAALILMKGSTHSLQFIVIYFLCLILIYKFKINSVWLILISGIMGLVLHLYNLKFP